MFRSHTLGDANHARANGMNKRGIRIGRHVGYIDVDLFDEIVYFDERDHAVYLTDKGKAVFDRMGFEKFWSTFVTKD